ncbi:MAG: PKD domain-containing protein, partial [Bacteroidota bacterium]
AGGGFVLYAWSDGTNTQTNAVSMAGDYSVQITNTTGCTASDTISVALDPLPTPDFSAMGGQGANWFNWSFTNLSVDADSYVWDFGDGGSTSTDPSPTHLYAFPGDYEVSLIATNDCGSDTFTLTITLTNTDGLEDELFGAVQIYPSPNNGQFEIKFGEKALGQTSVRIYNLQGQVVYQQTLSLVRPNQQVPVNLDDPIAGVYLLQLRSEGVEMHFKLLIQ